MSDNKFSVTFTFPTEEMLEDFVGNMSNSCEQHMFEYLDNDDDPWHRARFDYKRCFPAWGWKEGEPKFIDVEVDDE